jgi:hypothetical protein
MNIKFKIIFVVLYSTLEASTDVMNTGFLIVTVYMESEKLFHLFILFCVCIMETSLVNGA